MMRTPLLVFGVALAFGLGAGSDLGFAAPRTGDDLSSKTIERSAGPDRGALGSAVRLASLRVAIADPDHDGLVSRDEAERFHRARFLAMDADRDGVLSEAEFVDNGASARAASRSVAFRKQPSSEFEAIDLDGDGVLSREEFLRAGIWQAKGRRDSEKSRLSDRFLALDHDGDGRITRKDYLAAAAYLFTRSDKDAVGAITLWEFLTRANF